MNTDTVGKETLSLNGAIDKVSDIGCCIEQLFFIQNAMFNANNTDCTPAILMETPMVRIQESLEALSDYLKSREKMA